MAVREGAALYTVDKQGGELHKISLDEKDIFPCSWSLDSHWIYYATTAVDGWQISKVSRSGEDQCHVTNQGGIAAMESPDGRYLYLVRPDRQGIWRQSLDGGEAVSVVPDFRASEFINWTVNATGIYYFVRNEQGTSIKLYNPSDDSIDVVATLAFHPISRFSVSPDGKRILITRTEYLDIDLMMLNQIP
jgi:Tol biopolymer transport system component